MSSPLRSSLPTCPSHVDAYLEPLERMFEKLEAESEHKSIEEARSRAQSISTEPSPTLSTEQVKSRRRGSVSISRIGPLDELTKGTYTPKRVSATPSPSLFYQAEVKNESIDSFASNRPDGQEDESAYLEHDNRVTEIHDIARRQSVAQAVGNLLPRRLSRTRSATAIVPLPGSDVVIGVSVEESFGESVEATEPAVEEIRTVIVAPGSLSRKSSKTNISGYNNGSSNGVSWKGIAEKFRQKSRAIVGFSSS